MLARSLLMNSDVQGEFRGLCHTVLAESEEPSLNHAKAALDIFKGLKESEPTMDVDLQ